MFTSFPCLRSLFSAKLIAATAPNLNLCFGSLLVVDLVFSVLMTCLQRLHYSSEEVGNNIYMCPGLLTWNRSNPWKFSCMCFC